MTEETIQEPTETAPVKIETGEPSPAAKPKRARKAPAKISGEAVTRDADGNGLIDADAAQVEALILDLAPLDAALREHGSSVAELLRHVARTALGVAV